jgi:hypothetical protein
VLCCVLLLLPRLTITSGASLRAQIFADGSPAEYTPIGEWVRETSVYNMMKQLPFFRNYMSQVTTYHNNYIANWSWGDTGPARMGSQRRGLGSFMSALAVLTKQRKMVASLCIQLPLLSASSVALPAHVALSGAEQPLRAAARQDGGAHAGGQA